MKKSITLFIYLIISAVFIVGCSSSVIKEDNLEDLALKEANKIATEQGYSLKSDKKDSYTDVLIGDSEVFNLIKDASIKYGYSEDNFNSMTENRKILSYELNEKSKKDKGINLCLVIDKEKVIGSYLDYEDYVPGIEPVNFKDNFK